MHWFLRLLRRQETSRRKSQGIRAYWNRATYGDREARAAAISKGSKGKKRKPFTDEHKRAIGANAHKRRAEARKAHGLGLLRPPTALRIPGFDKRRWEMVELPYSPPRPGQRPSLLVTLPQRHFLMSLLRAADEREILVVFYGPTPESVTLHGFQRPRGHTHVETGQPGGWINLGGNLMECMVDRIRYHVTETGEAGHLECMWATQPQPREIDATKDWPRTPRKKGDRYARWDRETAPRNLHFTPAQLRKQARDGTGRRPQL